MLHCSLITSVFEPLMYIFYMCNLINSCYSSSSTNVSLASVHLGGREYHVHSPCLKPLHIPTEVAIG